MPRSRNKGRGDLPPNVYCEQRAKGEYYRYRHPVTGEMTTWGYQPRDKVIAAGKELNARFTAADRLVAKVMRGQVDQITLGEYIVHYRTKVLPGRRIKGHPLSADYLREVDRILNRIEERLGSDTPLAGLTQAKIAAYLNRQTTAEAANQHHKQLRQLYRHAVSDGLVPENIPEKILTRDTEPRVRERLTLDQYKAIYAEASPAIRNAMELSLNALQRRFDIQKWRSDHQRDGYAYVIQSKTRKHGPSAYLRIPLSLPVVHSERGSSTLGQVIDGCRDDVLCPFLIHERPKRVRKSKEKAHPFQLSRKQISDGFAAAREASGLFEELAPGERPSFHELIGLGEHLREKQGWTASEIQQLRGHTSERMTRVYLEGHEWTTVAVPAGTKKGR